MCKECEEKELVETKVCKTCGIEKPVGEFGYHGNNYYNNYCKVCGWMKRQMYNYSNKDFKYEDDIIILDYILNGKIKLINELCNILDKSLYDICYRVSKILKIGGITKLQVELECPICNAKFIVRPWDVLNNKVNCCSKACGSKAKIGKDIHKTIGIKNCATCGIEFEVKENVPNQKFCSSKCKSKCYNDNDLNKTETKCTNCEKIILKSKSQVKRYKNNFCCLTCELEFKHKKKYEHRKCEICDAKFEVLKSSDKRFCSNDCQVEWQRKYPKLGIENKNFTSILIKCDWCEKEYYEKPYKINGNQQNYFCSNNCRQEWYAKEFSQADNWKKECAERATSMLTNGVFGNTDTNIQIAVNNILDDLKIKYDNEYNCKYVAIDNALFINNKILFIECMGTYWHTDSREYKTINYAMQKNRIRLDKIKHSYIKDQYNIEILYLWEKDIIEKPKLCSHLIQMYIINNGVLDNFHSFNYGLNNNILGLNEKLIIPYMECDIRDINDITDLSVKEQMSRKQDDRWTKYICESCGKECEELTSHYIKNEHHYCSHKCYSKSKQSRIQVTCLCCNKEFDITTSKFKNSKTNEFFCSKECFNNYKKINNNVKFNCQNCGKETVQELGHFKKSVNHFCSYECSLEYKRKNKKHEKKLVYFICENCGEHTSKSTSDYNKGKHHFCSYKCSVKFRSKK